MILMFTEFWVGIGLYSSLKQQRENSPSGRPNSMKGVMLTLSFAKWVGIQKAEKEQRRNSLFFLPAIHLLHNKPPKHSYQNKNTSLFCL